MSRLAIEGILDKINPRGWINYYYHSRKSILYKLADLVNNKLRRFLEKKHKLSQDKSWKILMSIKEKNPKLFVHWYLITTSTQRAV